MLLMLYYCPMSQFVNLFYNDATGMPHCSIQLQMYYSLTYRTELFYYPPVVTTNMHNRTRNCIYAKYHLDTNKYNFNNTKCSWCYYYLQFRLHFPSNIHIEIV